MIFPKSDCGRCSAKFSVGQLQATSPWPLIRTTRSIKHFWRIPPDGNPYGFIRVNITTLGDPFALVTEDLTIKDPTKNYAINHRGLSERQYYNLARDPANPFLTPTSLPFTNVGQFNNAGLYGYWTPFTGGGLGGTDQHQLIAMRDPLTGHTMVIFGDDQGVWVGNDKGDGTFTAGIGTAQEVLGSRNGNLQITQFYQRQRGARPAQHASAATLPESRWLHGVAWRRCILGFRSEKS